MSDLLLFRRLPRLGETTPRIALADLPTPVERWRSLEASRSIGGLWVKRDDLTAPRFGGNKVRTLEFVLGRALESARPHVVCAPVGSAWAAACAYYGHLHGATLDFYLFRQPASGAPASNASIVEAYARRRVIVANPATLPFRLLADSLRRWERPPPRLPFGGSSSWGALGYGNAVLELEAQVQAGELERPDVIVIPLGSGGTTAGLLAGVTLLGWPTRILAVRVNDAVLANRFLVSRLARGALRHLVRGGAPHRRLRRSSLEIESRFFGGRYGRPVEAGTEAAAVVMRHQGLELDPTYTAKAMAALLARAVQGDLAGKNVLFWHTCNSRDPALALALRRSRRERVSLVAPGGRP